MTIKTATQSSKRSLTEDRRATPLKVCHVVATTEGGPWMVDQLRELRDQYGCEVAAVVSGEHGKLIDRLDSESIPHFAFEFTFTSIRGMLRMPFELFRLARLFRRQRFDVVQTHIFISMVLGRLAAWLADVPVRLAMIAGPFHLEAHTSRWIDRSTCWMETALIPACEASRRLSREMGVSEERLPLVYYSVDPKKFDPLTTLPVHIRQQFGWPEDTPVVGMIAYFYPRLSKSRWIPPPLQGHGVKGHDDLIKAAPIIRAEFPNAKILLVGSGWGPPGDTFMEEMKTLVRDLNLEETVVFAGYQSNVKGILNELDVAVQASLSENLGGTVEALVMQRPVVATRVGGMVDSVRDGETGVLVDPSSPEDLARGIIQLLRNPKRARELGRAGRELALERFSLDRTAQDLFELYSRLMNESRARRRGHNPFIFLWRSMLIFPVLGYIAFRLFVMDLFFPVYVPAYLPLVRQTLLRLWYLPIRIAIRIRNYLRDRANRFAGVLRRSLIRVLRTNAAPKPEDLDQVTRD
jgi:glycosyltransferase involved in cell wall biosynthesis